MELNATFTCSKEVPPTYTLEGFKSALAAGYCREQFGYIPHDVLRVCARFCPCDLFFQNYKSLNTLRIKGEEFQLFSEKKQLFLLRKNKEPTISVWDQKRATWIERLKFDLDELHAQPFWGGNYLFTRPGFYDRIKVWDLEKGELYRVLEKNRGLCPEEMCWGDGLLFVTYWTDHDITVWDLGKDKPIRTLEGGYMRPSALCWVEERDTLFYVCDYNKIKVWRPKEENSCPLTLAKYKTFYVSRLFWMAGYLLGLNEEDPKCNSKYNSSVIVCDPETGKRLTLLRKPGFKIIHLLEASGKKIVASDNKGTLVVWDLATLDLSKPFVPFLPPFKLLKEHRKAVFALISAGNCVCTASKEGRILLWNASFEPLRIFHTNPVRAIAFVEDERLLVTTKQGIEIFGVAKPDKTKSWKSTLKNLIHRFCPFPAY